MSAREMMIKELNQIQNQYKKAEKSLEKFNNKYVSNQDKYYVSWVAGDGIILNIDRNNIGLNEFLGIENVIDIILGWEE